MCYYSIQGVFHHMKKMTGVLVVLAALLVLASATVAQAGCYTKDNIVWCTDSTDPDDK